MQKVLESRGLTYHQLRVSHAFHTAAMDPILDEFRSVVARVPLREPLFRVGCNVTGGWLSAENAVSPDYWAQHMRSTVRFADNAKTLAAERDVFLLELGPSNQMTTLARRTPNARWRGETALLAPPEHDRNERRTLLRAVSEAWLNGATLDWAKIRAEPVGRVPLPTYPFERERFWVDPPAMGDVSESRELAATETEEAVKFFRQSWREVPLPAAGHELGGTGSFRQMTPA